jgi:replication factor A1
MLVGDWTSNRWVTMFSDVGEQIFEKKADEIAAIIEQGKDASEAFFQKSLFSPKIFKLRSKIETYGVSLRYFFFNVNSFHFIFHLFLRTSLETKYP